MKVFNSQRSFKVNLEDTSCFYFCDHFLKAFKEKSKIKDPLVLRKSNPNEVIGCCSGCKDEINKYFLPLDILSNEFFVEMIKL